MALLDGTSRLVLISAWNDSGGGFVTRLLDGHPAVASWPFELQLGTAARPDHAHHVIHAKYRWPCFDDIDSPFDAIIDDELKSVLRKRGGDKFRGFGLSFDERAWRNRFDTILPGHSRRDIVAAYVDSFFETWLGVANASPCVLGHCPSIVLDAADIFADFPSACVVHVARDPVAGFADFRRRHHGFSAQLFAARWNLVNGAAVAARKEWPENVLLVRYETVLADRAAAMAKILEFCGLSFNPIVLRPTWNGAAIDELSMGPFGGVPQIGLAYENEVVEIVTEADARLLRSATAGTPVPPVVTT